MTLRSNARTFPVAFPAAHAGGVWEQGGPRLPIGFWSSTEAVDTFAASGFVAAFGALAATEAADTFSAAGTVTTPSASSRLLLVDGASFALQTDSVSKILLAASVAGFTLLSGAALTLLDGSTFTLL